MKAIVFQDKFNNGYLYSFYRKRLLPLDPLLYKLVYKYLYSNKEDFECLYKQDQIVKIRFDFLLENSFLKEKKIFVDETLSAQEVQDRIKELPMLIFELTEKCNLQCKYCIYGEMYTVFSSKKEEMTFEISKSVIDYFVSLSHPNRKNQQTISFYGGEPLLQFELIKKIVEYTQKIDTISYLYTITTNGLLLGKYYKQLINWGVRILVSLDGDKYSSQYRVSKTGKESFNRVYNGLMKIKKEYPIYFRDMVDFNSVMHDKNPLDRLLPFMKKEFNKIPQCAVLSPAYVNQEHAEEFKEMANNDFAEIKDCDKLSMEYIYRSKPQIMAILSFMNSFSGYTFSDFEQLFSVGQIEHYVPSGTCVPCSSRLLISANGILYPCERIGYMNSLGNVQPNGKVRIDVNSISTYYNSLYDRIRIKCSNCYNVYNCSNCLFQNNLTCKPVTREQFTRMIQRTINGIHLYGKNFKE